MRIPTVLIAVISLVTVATSSVAAQTPETIFTSKAKITPKKAGTKKKPRGIKISGSFAFKTITQGIEPPIVTGGEVLIAKGGSYNGGRYKSCSRALMDREKTTSVCDKRSIMGSGTGIAYADNVNAEPEIEFVNGGKTTVWAFTTLYRPALVQKAVRLKIQKLRSRKWGYKASFAVPKVLQVVAGVPITLRSLKYSIGGKPYAKDFITTTSCPKSRKYPYEARAHYLYADDTTATATSKGTVACR